MVRLDTLVKRIRTLGEHKGQERVLTENKYETLTSTQACRFKQLQRIRVDEREAAEAAEPAREWFDLDEASVRLATSTERLLEAAAAGNIVCYVTADGLRGRWQQPGTGGPAGDPPAMVEITHLRLPKNVCHEMMAYGSVNVSMLEHETGDGDRIYFELQEPLWTDPDRILLKHPLPEFERD